MDRTFGPYTESEIRQYIASGNVGMSDLVQAESSGAWVPVLELFPPTAAGFVPVAPPIAAPRALYPDPPDFPWWGALLLGMVTGGLFFVVWDIVQASWLKRIQRDSTALLFYIGVAILYVFKLPSVWATMDFNMFGGPIVHGHGSGLSAVGTMLAVVARFIFRRELTRHFNEREGLGIQLNWFLTLLFGGLYFQFRFNKINALNGRRTGAFPRFRCGLVKAKGPGACQGLLGYGEDGG